MATLLHKQLNGFIPMSSHNSHARSMLDDYYLPEACTNVDISKAYPATLLRNKHPITLYSIHDAFLPYSKGNIAHCDEFYVDEWTLVEAYGEDIGIETRF